MYNERDQIRPRMKREEWAVIHMRKGMNVHQALVLFPGQISNQVSSIGSQNMSRELLALLFHHVLYPDRRELSLSHSNLCLPRQKIEGRYLK